MPLTADSLRVPHGFFSRQGGVSGGPYASLNCSLSGGDARDAVLENRARAARAIGAEPDRPRRPDAGARRGRRRSDGTVAPGQRPARRRDGDRPARYRPRHHHRRLCARSCWPTREAGVAGAAHAGWRGAAAGVIEATVAAMIGLGATPASIDAAIGPCIGQNSYEVGPDLRRCGPRTRPRTCALLRAGTPGGALAVRPCRVLRRPARRHGHSFRQRSRLGHGRG